MSPRRNVVAMAGVLRGLGSFYTLIPSRFSGKGNAGNLVSENPIHRKPTFREQPFLAIG